MKFVSFCSGIEAASGAWRPLGWQCVGVSEIDPFARAVLAHRQPEAPDLGDMTTLLDDPARLGQLQEAAPDVAIAGCPCQSFSIAGLRKGLADGSRKWKG